MPWHPLSMITPYFLAYDFLWRLVQLVATSWGKWLRVCVAYTSPRLVRLWLEQWDFALIYNHKHPFHLQLLQGTWKHREVCPARWIGHRRHGRTPYQQQQHSKSWHSKNGDTATWRQVAHLLHQRGARPRRSTSEEPRLHAYPSMVYGMERNLAQELRQRIRLVGGCPRGRQCPWWVDTGQTWQELQWEVARVLRRGVATFRIYMNDEPVHMDEVIPPTRRQRDIELRRVPPDEQARSRSRSRDPDWQPEPPARGRQRRERPEPMPRTPQTIHEAERLDFVLSTVWPAGAPPLP